MSFTLPDIVATDTCRLRSPQDTYLLRQLWTDRESVTPTEIAECDAVETRLRLALLIELLPSARDQRLFAAASAGWAGAIAARRAGAQPVHKTLPALVERLGA